MAVIQAQIIESMIAATLEEKKQWVNRLQRKYDRQNPSKQPSSLTQNRTPSFMQTKPNLSQRDNKGLEKSQDDQGHSLVLVGSPSPPSSHNQTQKTTVSS